jgi:hypothetical protein
VICPQLCETERVKNSKDQATKFDLWTGLRDLSFIIPKNFNNLGQKSGSRSGAAAVANAAGAATGKSRKGQHGNDGLDEDGKKAKGETTFVGLKSPEHLKKACSMFKSQ